MFSLATHDVYQELQLENIGQEMYRWQAKLYQRDGTCEETLIGQCAGTRQEIIEDLTRELHFKFDQKYPPKEST